jgi:hypothetical protein
MSNVDESMVEDAAVYWLEEQRRIAPATTQVSACH